MRDATSTACRATTKTGKPCQAAALSDSGYCWAHDPALREKRQAARSAGGHARHRRRITWSDDELRASIRLGSVQDVIALLEKAVVAEMSLENSHARNRTIASLATAALKALEVGELEQRIALLEAQIHAKPER